MVVLPTFFQFPEMRRWILTGTLAVHAVNPSPTLTTPLARRCFFRLSVTLLGCVLLTVKSVALVAVPPPFVTLILPVVAVEGTVAVIWVAEFTTNVAVTLLKVTPVVVKLTPLTVPLKFVPVIFTDAPAGPKAGVNEVIVGAGTGTTVKFPLLRAVFPPDVTRTGPVVAPVGTVAVIWVGEFTTTPVAVVWLNLTVTGAMNPVPVMTTDVPTTPVKGLKPVTETGHAVLTVSNATESVSPTASVTTIGAIPAPLRTAPRPRSVWSRSPGALRPSRRS